MPKDAHQRTYNEPTANEVAVVIPTDNTTSNEILQRNLIVHYKDKSLKYIHETNALYDPLQYVLFHPFGSFGFAWGIPKQIIKNPKERLLYLFLYLHFTFAYLKYKMQIYSKCYC